MRKHEPDYLKLSIGAPMRLANLRARVTQHNANRPPSTQYADWRAARAYGFGNWRAAYSYGMNPGFNGTGRAQVPVWYTFERDALRGEIFADEIRNSPVKHRGWFCDEEQRGIARGIVGMLSHGRYAAGYRLSETDETVWFADVFDDQREAAQMADEHARIIGEAELDHSHKWNEARELERERDEQRERIGECFAMRHSLRADSARAELAELAQSVRAIRARLTSEFADVN